ncbi:MAG: glycosyltransferase [Chloroflexi bacterium]|nr:glycosyltransferase [Chloroflexota bacterium]MCI0574660.1 glycosyltransferase [Chloroflexota bacterium]MCI0649058.1 glycosyltransferase [Chloroflexota bacterium]MCI0725149.1 glycosyltransferase [Chloroflexota bacterium]
MNVSVIATVKNPGEEIRSLLDSLMYQTRRPDEVVICDSSSTDDTLNLLHEYQLRLPLCIVAAPGSNISQGRNRAIAAAAGPVIAATDAGVVLAPDWLAELLRPIEAEGAAVVSGWFEPDPYTDFEVVMSATVLPELDEINPRKFLPSSRSVAFLKSAWEAAGGYPEWLDYSEDLIFDLALREQYGPFPFAPRAVAYYRPRASLRAFARQYYLYARGDGKANLWPKRHAIRYLTYLVALPALLSLIWRNRWSGWALGLAGMAVYCRRPAQRLWPATAGWPPPDRLRAFALIPLIRLVGDVAKMAGYPVGLIWRLGHRPKGHIRIR